MEQQQEHWGHRAALYLATGFGLGSARVAPGTFGTLLGIPLYLLISLLPPLAYLAVVVVLFCLGIAVCEIAERELGRDYSGIVWDEVIGYLVAMFLAPAGLIWMVLGFILFRVFDIWKPYPIRDVEEAVQGGLGCMLDDVLAGVYAFIAMQFLAWFSELWKY